MSDDDIAKYEPVIDEKKNKGGRPPDYGQEVLDDCEKYIMGGWKDYGQSVPSMVGLSLFIGCAKSTVYKWRGEEDKKEFSDYCEIVMDMQEACLISNGLNGVFAPTITKLILTKHGYTDKVDTNHTNDGGSFNNNPVNIDTSKLSVDQLKALKDALNVGE